MKLYSTAPVESFVIDKEAIKRAALSNESSVVHAGGHDNLDHWMLNSGDDLEKSPLLSEVIL